jgi:hypothetical protein
LQRLWSNGVVVTWKALATASFVVAWAAIAGSFNVHAGSAQASPTEYQVKAAYLCHFPKFIEWPASVHGDDQASITLGILGEDPFGAALKPAEGKRVTGRKMVIRHLEKLDQVEKCHIVFVSRSEEERLSEILRKARNWNALTISDMEGFAERGGVIGFITLENKIHFAINVDAAERIGLKISSKLLRLAKIVQDEEKRAEH